MRVPGFERQNVALVALDKLSNGVAPCLARRDVAPLAESGFYLPGPLLRLGLAGETLRLLRVTFEPRAYAVGDLAVQIDPLVER